MVNLMTQYYDDQNLLSINFDKQMDYFQLSP